MNEKLTQWLAALRSGAYKQGKGTLVNKGNEYCCLGVLCEITPEFKRSGGGYHSPSGVACIGSIDAQYLRTLGFKDQVATGPLAKPIGSAQGPFIGIASLFIALNDNYGLTFTQIADYVEQEAPSVAT